MPQENDRHTGHTLTRPYYGDYRFYHPDGMLMFIASEYRAQFYLNKGIVEADPSDPKKFTFKEIPGGYGYWHSDLHNYHLKPKKNQCVVCGSKEYLTRHHVLPVTFQRYYPNERHDAGVRSHDMLLLCLDCHETYEREYGDRIREDWAIKYKANRNHKYETNRTLTLAIKAARTLLTHKVKLPKRAKAHLLKRVQDWLGHPPVKADLKHIAELSWAETKRLLKKSDLGKKVTDNWDLGELRKFWRRHFVESMKPQFLPEGWSVDAPVERQFMK